MKSTILVLFIFLGTIVRAQNIKYLATDAFGISCNIADVKIDQKQGDIHYNPIFNRGLSLFYTYSYYLNKNNYFSATVAPGINFFKEDLIVPAGKYNLDSKIWTMFTRYIPSLSVYLSYSYIFKETQKNSFYFTLSPGIVSAAGYNQKMGIDVYKVDSFSVMRDKYRYKPTPVINFELGIKRKLKNGNFINLSFNPQYSFFTKYENENEFFLAEPKFYSLSSLKTNLSYIGFKISYEIKEKK